MTQKQEFIERFSRGEKVAALCREYGISRETGHKWIRRFKEAGYDGLEDRSRRPKLSGIAFFEGRSIKILEGRDSERGVRTDR